jgi:hypothetical protein
MNCGEAVKPGRYAVEALRKQVLNRRPPTLNERIIRGNTRQSVAKVSAKTNAARGQPPQAALFRGSLSLVSPPPGAARRRYRSDSALASATFIGTNCRAAIHGTAFPQPVRLPAAQPALKQEVEEAASPGNQHALTRISDFPWQFTLENRQLPPASPQSSFDNR